jgi:putative membrane protein insertion efficiency factor
MKFWLMLWFLPRNLVIALVLAYRKVISPLYGDVCRYYPSCSAYGLEQFQQHGVVAGSVLTTWRILRCNPWSAGGVDKVRPNRRGIRVNRFGFVSPVFVSTKEGQ